MFAVGCGAVLLRGAIRRWEWLVDPAKEWWFCYSQSLIKVLIGSEGCRGYTMFLGASFVAFGMYLIVYAACST
ncbi:hypothetical protein GCM10009105_23960 [Dokdonella soli]|uniref:Uncharacterized protein n=1 Tax=Dokdonella soli TaxID=529810 RepID=A0ABN1ILY9_9GAMM